MRRKNDVLDLPERGNLPATTTRGWRAITFLLTLAVSTLAYLVSGK